MKNGIKIVIHNSIKDDIKKEVEKWLLQWLIAKINTKEGIVNYKIGYSNSSSFYRRGILGLSLFNTYNSPLKKKYFFRRLTKSRRIFGVVPISEIISKDNSNIDLNQCMCAIHLGGTKVKLKKTYDDNDYSIFFQIGDIKG